MGFTKPRRIFINPQQLYDLQLIICSSVQLFFNGNKIKVSLHAYIEEISWIALVRVDPNERGPSLC